MRYGIALAVPAAALPHAVATAMRCWRLRRYIDQNAVFRFGFVSAVGGFLGSALAADIQSEVLVKLVGVMLVLSALSVWTGVAMHRRSRMMLVPLLGFLSGFFGGLAGNQGGLRAAVLGAFGLTPLVFVATFAAIALIVDAVRTPFYLWQSGVELAGLWLPVALATAAAATRTVIGERLLPKVSPANFKNILAAAVGVLGLHLLIR